MKISRGFTLLEVSIALVVTGLLISGGMSLMSGASDVTRYKSTQAELVELKEVLQSYYALYYRLPCPAPNRDGVAATTCDTADSLRGYLPYNSLGIGGNGDSWGQPYKYVVSPVFTHDLVSNKPYICTANFAQVRNATGKVSVKDLSGSDLVDYAAFVVLSTGKNGQQSNAGMNTAFSNSGCAGALVDPVSGTKYEQKNCDADSELYHGLPRTDGNSIIFDDMLTWVGDMQLIGVVKGTGVCDVLPPPAVLPEETIQPSAPQPETQTDYNFGATTHSGNYHSGFFASPTISTSNSNDRVVISGNLQRTLDLKNGSNSLLVGGNASGDIKGGDGIDIVRVGGNLVGDVDLKNGNDQLEVLGDVYQNAKIDMGDGDDQVRIYGALENTVIELGRGTNSIYVRGGAFYGNVDIKATGGTAILYYDAPSKPIISPTRNWVVKLGSTVTIKCKINGAWVSCP